MERGMGMNEFIIACQIIKGCLEHVNVRKSSITAISVGTRHPVGREQYVDIWVGTQNYFIEETNSQDVLRILADHAERQCGVR